MRTRRRDEFLPLVGAASTSVSLLDLEIYLLRVHCSIRDLDPTLHGWMAFGLRWLPSDRIARRSKASSRAICARFPPSFLPPETRHSRLEQNTPSRHLSCARSKLVILMPTLRTLFALACLCSAAHAFVAAPPAALALRSSAAVHSSPIVSASTPSRSTDLVLSETKTASPIAWAVCAGGSAGIVFAAFCTSTGSPPTGLAVAGVTILLMVLGASTFEEA